ncbi:MAG: hypothetical protein A2887_05815 [Alphaproteobacteria bacterium RIFCSPLOWO2_01_FULL_40_26]|nr:MAG: hypothetical protein A3D15_02075 [Alphaproteobacteria bacterium RIFCSPHIGHO2_02_FULL_40_34]OFW94244.1 MAG: hypothetical protein A2887_05815 [Alphaproteobacteria bacterium RIFCSPLOWO2_01_FULL_40_26]OFX09813.1 MAG: hypothetical protein A3H30_00575 [Alphaproteobacteria bacterium RIFCSPLOWO2_02_FULL_40_19]OFX12246.1 MAG: hypothetical protein A3G22_06855 [Alphaproteobacteria bacterium RIFCSPLOWO2_12_FULL_40_11]
MTKIINAVVILLFLSCATAHSKQDTKNDSKPINDILKEFESLPIFSLSKKRENAFDLPSAVYVLSSEEIRRSGATSIPEALRLVPGVQVSRLNGHSYAITIRGFNRQYSNRILVLIDGRTIYSPLFGVPWHIYDYVLEDIDRIEVIRGSGGAIWGAGAVNGVINIITKSAIKTSGAYVSQIVGNQDQSITEARYGGEVAGKDYYRLYAKRVLRDGVDRYDTKTRNDDGLRTEMSGFRYDTKTFDDGSLSIHGDVFHNVAQNYFTQLDNPKKNNISTTGGNIMASWENRISKKSNLNLRSYFTYNKIDVPILQIDEKIFDVDFQHFYDLSKNNKFIWGVGYRQIIYDRDFGTTANGAIPIYYSSNHENDQLFTAFIQDRIGLIPDELYLTIGSKFEHNDLTGFEYQPNARLSYYPTPNQTVWAAISRSVRTPTMGEGGSLDLKITNKADTLSRGSTTYESEQLISYEIGYRVRPTQRTLIDATIFYDDYSKLRTYEATGPDNTIPTTANLGFGESYGFEINGKWQATNRLKLEASYDFVHIDLHISDNSTDRLSYRGQRDALEMTEGQTPQHQLKLKSFYNLTPELQFDNMAMYVDNLPEAGSTHGAKGLPSYLRFDTRLGYLATDNLDLSLGIQNLFDQRHQEFKSALYNRKTEVGRTFYFKLTWQY